MIWYGGYRGPSRLSSGATEIVGFGAQLDNAVVSNGVTLVASIGLTDSTTLLAGGVELVTDAGGAGATVISGGTEIVTCDGVLVASPSDTVRVNTNGVSPVTSGATNVGCAAVVLDRTMPAGAVHS